MTSYDVFNGDADGYMHLKKSGSNIKCTSLLTGSTSKIPATEIMAKVTIFGVINGKRR